MHPANIGKMYLVRQIYYLARLHGNGIIERSWCGLYGKEVVIVGHSEIVGKP